LKGVLGELALAKQIVTNIKGEVILKCATKPGEHLADIISFNTITGKLTLWDAKFRSAAVLVKQSRTFTNEVIRAQCLAEAQTYIRNTPLLTQAQKNAAIQSIESDTFQMKTIGMGNARSLDSIFQ